VVRLAPWIPAEIVGSRRVSDVVVGALNLAVRRRRATSRETWVYISGGRTC
jgi:hypothetical protein